jgi:hypothetical protein
MDQLKTIFRALGTPTEEEWPVRVLRLISPFMLFHLSAWPILKSLKINAEPAEFISLF